MQVFEPDHVIHTLVSVAKSTGVQCAYDESCPGVLYQFWIFGYAIYLAWMSVCMTFVMTGTTFLVIFFQDWTDSVPLGFMGCQKVIDAFA